MTATQAGIDAGIIDQTRVLTNQINRFFNPEQYLDNGYQNAITLNEDIFPMAESTKVDSYKWISETYVQFYTAKFVDTAAITFHDYSTRLQNF